MVYFGGFFAKLGDFSGFSLFAVAEAEGLGEVLEEAWATTEPDLMEY